MVGREGVSEEEWEGGREGEWEGGRKDMVGGKVDTDIMCTTVLAASLHQIAHCSQTPLGCTVRVVLDVGRCPLLDRPTSCDSKE